MLNMELLNGFSVLDWEADFWLYPDAVWHNMYNGYVGGEFGKFTIDIVKHKNTDYPPSAPFDSLKMYFKGDLVVWYEGHDWKLRPKCCESQRALNVVLRRMGA